MTHLGSCFWVAIAPYPRLVSGSLFFGRGGSSCPVSIQEHSDYPQLISNCSQFLIDQFSKPTPHGFVISDPFFYGQLFLFRKKTSKWGDIIGGDNFSDTLSELAMQDQQRQWSQMQRNSSQMQRNSSSHNMAHNQAQEPASFSKKPTLEPSSADPALRFYNGMVMSTQNVSLSHVLMDGEVLSHTQSHSKCCLQACGRNLQFGLLVSPALQTWTSQWSACLFCNVPLLFSNLVKIPKKCRRVFHN